MRERHSQNVALPDILSAVTHSPLISSLLAAVAANPDDLPLRLHLAELLLAAGARDEAITHAAQALVRDPGNIEAQR